MDEAKYITITTELFARLRAAEDVCEEIAHDEYDICKCVVCDQRYYGEYDKARHKPDCPYAKWLELRGK